MTPDRRWRWRVVGMLDRLPGTCWANITSWALGDRALFDPGNGEDIRQNWMCRRDLEKNGSCYCNKLTAHPEPEESRG